MPPTISQRALVAGALLLTTATAPRAQSTARPPDDPFAAGRWHAEATLEGALEAWNYNISHEELYGLVQGLTYGVRNGLALTLHQRVYYVSQRANDSWLLGLTFGLRGRIYERGRATVFLDGSLGISDGAIAAPPRGTRFNYLAIGGGGVLFRVGPRVHVLTALQLIHISNASLRGRSRNPDIEAIGPTIGAVFGF
jgi:hypothetical protein